MMDDEVALRIYAMIATIIRPPASSVLGGISVRKPPE
jgi:hypothetical protein